MADKLEDGNGSSEDGPLYYEVEHQPKAWPVLYLGCPTEHSRYIPAPEFGLAHLPEDIRCQEVLALIRLNMELAVRLSVAVTQTRTQDTGHINQAPHTMSTDTVHINQAPESKCDPYHVRGSGSVCYFSDTHDLFPCCHGDVNQCPRCHIPKCPYTETLGADHFFVSSHPVHVPDASRAHLAFRVSTNQHVVRDEADAGSTKVDLFFDSCNTRDTVKARGVCLAGVWEEQDKVHVLCVADMNSRLQQLLQTMRQDMRRLFAAIPEEKRKSFIQNHVIIIGHPHGSAKVVSVGRKMSSGQETSPCGSLYLETRYLIETCNGSSGAPVVGPGWADGGPGYRVHCGFYRSGDMKTGISKSFWVVDSDERGGAPVKNRVPDTSGLR